MESAHLIPARENRLIQELSAIRIFSGRNCLSWHREMSAFLRYPQQWKTEPVCRNLREHFRSEYMMSVLPKNMQLHIVIGTPTSHSILSMYFIHSRGSSSVFLMPLISLFQHRLCLFKPDRVRETVHFVPVYLISCANRSLIKVSERIHYR